MFWLGDDGWPQNSPLLLEEASPLVVLGTLSKECETALCGISDLSTQRQFFIVNLTNSQEVCRPSCALQLALDEQSECVPGL